MISSLEMSVYTILLVDRSIRRMSILCRPVFLTTEGQEPTLRVESTSISENTGSMFHLHNLYNIHGSKSKISIRKILLTVRFYNRRNHVLFVPTLGPTSFSSFRRSTWSFFDLGPVPSSVSVEVSLKSVRPFCLYSLTFISTEYRSRHRKSLPTKRYDR